MCYLHNASLTTQSKEVVLLINMILKVFQSNLLSNVNKTWKQKLSSLSSLFSHFDKNLTHGNEIAMSNIINIKFIQKLYVICNEII